VTLISSHIFGRTLLHYFLLMLSQIHLSFICRLQRWCTLLRGLNFS